MKHLRAIVFLVMALLIASGIFLLTHYQTTGVASEYTSHPVAYIEAANISASFKVSGRIQEILVSEGDHVKKGQVLARLENKELEAKVAQAEAVLKAALAKQAQALHAVDVTQKTAVEQVVQAEAALKAAQAQLEALRNGARTEDRKKAEIQLEATQKAYKIAETNLMRMQELLKNGLVSQAAVDEATLQYEKAKAEYLAAQQQMEIIQNGSRKEEIKAAEAQVEQAKAALEMAKAGKGQVQLREDDVLAAEASVAQAQAALEEAKTYLQYTELTAPADGVIVSRSAELGELVSAGFAVFTIEQDQEYWAYFYFPESEITQFKVGQTVELKVLANQEKVTGTISLIKPAADFAVRKATQNMDDTDIRSFGVKVLLPKLPDGLHTGMTVQWEGVVSP